MEPKEIFYTLVNEFGFRSHSVNNDQWINVKYKNYSGFLMQYRCNENMCLIASGIDCKKGIFWGSDSYYDYDKAKDKINKFILLDKQFEIENKIEDVNGDFK